MLGALSKSIGNRRSYAAGIKFGAQRVSDYYSIHEQINTLPMFAKTAHTGGEYKLFGSQTALSKQLKREPEFAEYYKNKPIRPVKGQEGYALFPDLEVAKFAGIPPSYEPVIPIFESPFIRMVKETDLTEKAIKTGTNETRAGSSLYRLDQATGQLKPEYLQKGKQAIMVYEFKSFAEQEKAARESFNRLVDERKKLYEQSDDPVRESIKISPTKDKTGKKKKGKQAITQ
jgi:hypothetical protein